MKIARRIILLGGADAATYARRPAPAGFHWVFVTRLGARVTRLGIPLVALVPLGIS